MIQKNYNLEVLHNTIDFVDEVIYMYEVRKLSMPLIANHLNISYSTVRKILTQNYINIRPKNNHA